MLSRPRRASLQHLRQAVLGKPWFLRGPLGFSPQIEEQGEAVVSSHRSNLDPCLRTSFSECNTDSEITSPP